MNNFHLVNWTFPNPKKNQNASIFGDDHPCVQIFKAGDHHKPMYSKVDRSDPMYPLNYYRVRYHPKAYDKFPNGYGIFDVIALQDRFLLVTGVSERQGRWILGTSEIQS
jgi:hypothetical protein